MDVRPPIHEILVVDDISQNATHHGRIRRWTGVRPASEVLDLGRPERFGYQFLDELTPDRP